MSWLEEVTTAVEKTAGVASGELQLGDDVRREILDLARIASHSSGERINAPLLCYTLGIAVGRGAALGDLAGAVRAGGGEAK
jgi:hypothetical protein